MQNPAICFIISRHLNVHQHAPVEQIGAMFEGAFTGRGNSGEYRESEALHKKLLAIVSNSRLGTYSCEEWIAAQLIKQ
jgi:hypothetical protein